MGKISKKELSDFIAPNIDQFRKKLLENLLSLKLDKLLKRKNPYLFKAKAVDTAQDIVKSVLDAHLSSQEEGIFGGFLEELAIFVCGKVYNGRKSSAEGIDLEFDADSVHYIISIKSGPNWGNSSQTKKLKDNFRKAKRILGAKIHVVAINGCCYGKDARPNKGDYLKLCGQQFWRLISGDEHFYLDIIEPLGVHAKSKNEQFKEEYSKVINRFTVEFAKQYCDKNGAILWEALVKFNSGK
ncbi:MAG: PmeII family type II restriction endonuclease [Kiritimatiellales bacterium]